MKQTVQFFSHLEGEPRGDGFALDGKVSPFAHKSAASIGQTHQAENMKKALAAWLSQARACVPAEVHREAKGKPTVLGVLVFCFLFLWGFVDTHTHPGTIDAGHERSAEWRVGRFDRGYLATSHIMLP